MLQYIVTVKNKRLLYFAHSDYITIDNYYYLLSLYKTKGYNIKWKIMNLKKFVLKIVRVIISMTIKLEDFDFDILIDEKSHENILIYNISYKTLIDPKPLHIRFFKIDGFIRIYNETRYLALFGSENYDAIYNRTRYLISQKSGSTYLFSHYFAKINFNSYDSLYIEKRFDFS